MTWTGDTEFLDTLRLRLTSRETELQDELAVVTAARVALGGAGDPAPPSSPPAPRPVRQRTAPTPPEPTLTERVRAWASDGRGAFTTVECAGAVSARPREASRALAALEQEGKLTAVDGGSVRPTYWRWIGLGSWLPQPWAHIKHIGEGGDTVRSVPDEDEPLDPSVKAALEPRPMSAGFIDDPEPYPALPMEPDLAE